VCESIVWRAGQGDVIRRLSAHHRTDLILAIANTPEPITCEGERTKNKRLTQRIRWLSPPAVVVTALRAWSHLRGNSIAAPHSSNSIDRLLGSGFPTPIVARQRSPDTIFRSCGGRSRGSRLPLVLPSAWLTRRLSNSRHTPPGHRSSLRPFAPRERHV